ncbi:MAG TPA: alpha-(1-_3)-arabinofuranosyltransferase family protein [Nocardioides sp.]|nr:alpha-(1->3)-arabinofuranosyltransferase family protein [Nocardioides sp.]
MPEPGLRGDRRCTALVCCVYAVLSVLVLTEQWGRTTNDTRLELTERPASYLAGTFSLWQPGTSLGELQNQAYGYLFPQGSFFTVVEWLGVPGWVTQRLWSVLLLLLACEGVRRLARALGTGPWAAAAAGLAYGLGPRIVSEFGLRSGEILPSVVLPWAVLPLVLMVEGRRRPRDAALLSVAAFVCGGGVNGTATAAPAALLAIVVGWAAWRRFVGWRFVAGWLALMAAANAWWVVSLVRLGSISPPFFDYVEDARTTTSTAGFSASLRGTSNWIDYLQVGGTPWWPAGWQLTSSPWLVLGSGLVATLGLVGLLRWRSRWRAPLLAAAAFGLLCQVGAHTAPLDGPLAGWLRGLLDGSLAPLRNIPKADPVLRLPLAVGIAVVVDEVARVGLRRVRGVRQVAAAGIALVLAGGLVAMSAPVVAANTRIPGWSSIPSYWTDAAAYVAKRPGTTWVIPGSGFGTQTWGWTMEEPMDAVARSGWVSRSQVPLTPAGTIRVLSQLESYLETGTGSAYLRFMLARLGVTQVLLRHDLDQGVAQVPSASTVAVALARSPGITRVRSFGQLAFGPAIEVFRVEPVPGAQGYDARDSAAAVTVTSVEDGLTAVGNSLVAPDQPMVVAGTSGRNAPVDVVGDGYRRREREYGQVHDAVSSVMTADDPSRTDRVLPDYPEPGDAQPVVARYLGIRALEASSSRGWADTVGAVHPEDGPWSALDGDPRTAWRPGAYDGPAGQWWQVDLLGPTPIGRVTLTGAGTWTVSAGDVSRTVHSDGEASVDLGGAVAGSLRVTAASADAGALAEVGIAGVHAERTLVVPPVTESADPSFLFTATPETRACVPTLLGPDCDPSRQRAAEEETGIDRTFTVSADGTWQMRGLVVTPASPATLVLLQPLGGVTMSASSTYGSEPAVSPRMAYDTDPATEWIADPRDPAPSLQVDLGRVRTIRGLSVAAPSGVAVAPTGARITTPDGRSRSVAFGALGPVATFAPLRTRQLTVTFTGSRGSATGAPLGVAELRLTGGHVGVPLDGAGPTGSVCGYGPPLVVDGHRVETRVSGTIGDVVADGELAVHPCGVRRWRLAAGVHRVQLLSTEQFQPVALGLLPTRATPAPDGRSRTISVVSSTDTRTVLQVGPGADAIISAPFNVNAGWTATVGGHTLAPLTVDGWAQGWRIPAGTSGRVVLSFTPQQGYVAGLVAGLVLLALVLLAACWLLVRPGRAGSTVPEGRIGRPGGPGRPWAGVVLGLAGWVLAGPVVGVAALAGWLAGRWPRACVAVVGAALVSAYVVTAVQLTGGPRLPSDPVDLLVGAAVALGLGAAVRRSP